MAECCGAKTEQHAAPTVPGGAVTTIWAVKKAELNLITQIQWIKPVKTVGPLQFIQ